MGSEMCIRDRVTQSRVGNCSAKEGEGDEVMRCNRIRREEAACKGGVKGRREGAVRQSGDDSLLCHEPSASRLSQAMAANRPTPATEISSSAANMRGMLSW